MSRKYEEVKVHFNFESDLKRDTIEDFFQNQGRLIDYTKTIDDCSNLCDIDHLRSKYKFSAIDSSTIPPKYPWVNNNNKLNKFLKDTQHISSVDTQNLNGKELGSLLLKIQTVKRLLSTSHHYNVDREQKIAITGRGSMGKSTILKLLLGHDVTYSATGESTMLITEYYVHYIDVNSPCRFYFNACNDVDPSKEIHDEIDPQNSTQIIPAETVLGNKIKAENRAQQAITTTSAPLQIAIYTNKALVYGLLIDFPGLRGNTPAGSAANNDDGVIDRMETLLSESSDESTIIVTETISKTSGGYVTSIEYLAEKMKSKNILKIFLEKCSIVINQTNNCFTNGGWNLQQPEENAFLENNRILLEHISNSCIDAGVPFIKPIFLSIDMDLNNIIKPWNKNYDRNMKSLLEPRLQDSIYNGRIVCDGVEYVINDIVGKQKSSVLSSRSDYQNLLKSLMDDYKNNNASSEEIPYVMDGLLQAEEQLFRFITYFMEGRDGPGAHTAKCKVCIARDNEPKLHVYLKDMFKKGGELYRSEYYLRDKLVTDLTLEVLMQECLDEANTNKSVFKDPLKRDGNDEIIETAKGIFAFMLNLKLSKFDKVRFESQRTRTGDSTCVRSSIKTGIDEIVNDDIRVIIEGIMKYLSDTLNWIYPQIIDAALLQRMNVDDNEGPNALNVVESMLELRYRCAQALQFWISEVLVLLNNNIEKVIDNKLEDETKRNEYASELFALQIASILGEINNVFKREFVPFSSPQTSQRVAFKRIFQSYVYHDVGVPYLTNVVDTKYTYVKKVTIAKSSHPFTIQANDRDDHEKRLENIYKWNRNNPVQTVVDDSEKTLCDALSYVANNDDKLKSFMT